jgi:ABC-2 type transport system permease protein
MEVHNGIFAVCTLLKNEILKTFLKWRSFIGFAAIGVVVPLVHLSLWMNEDALVRSYARGLAQDFLLLGDFMNGYLVSYFMLNALWVHVPFLVTLGAGDQLAGEATGGTFRVLLIRPASRTSVLVAKYITALLYSALLVMFLAVLALVPGIILFGTGPLIVPGNTIVILPEASVPMRLAGAIVLAVWGMWTVASLAFLFSALVENAIGPILGTMAVVIVLYVIGNIPVELFTSLKPYLFTTYLPVWLDLLKEPVPVGSMLTSASVLGAHSVGFFLATWYIFARKDILS